MDCTNRQVAEMLRLMGQLHEVRGDNPFRVRAFMAGADAVERLPRRVNELDIEELRALAGIGDRLASVVQEICGTGSSEELAASASRESGRRRPVGSGGSSVSPRWPS